MRKQNRWKQILSVVLTATMLLASPLAAFAESIDENSEVVAEDYVEGSEKDDTSVLEEINLDIQPDEEGNVIIEQEPDTETVPELPDEEELLTQYFDKVVETGQKISMNSQESRRIRAYRKRMFLNRKEDQNAAVYEKLYEAFDAIANGRSDTSVVQIPFSAFLSQTEYTAEELGVEELLVLNDNQWQFAPGVGEALGSKIQVDVHRVMDALLVDVPFELYWFDKTAGYGSSSQLSYGYKNSKVYFTDDSLFTFKFAVAEAYGVPLQDRSEQTEENPYPDDWCYVDKEQTGAVSSTAENALQIVRDSSAKDDYNKLVDYRTIICNEVTYNTEAAKNAATPYGDPWQMIYVFDKDPNTNVVCEGYSKAFKFLCDLTEFDSAQIESGIVTGTMSGGTGAGNHMWNLMKMDDGKNYLVDVTNCDGNSIGAPDKLFLAGGKNQTKIGFTAAGVSYEYDADTLGIYSEDELVLSACDYGKHTWQESARKDASCTEDGSVTYTCSVCKTTKTEVIPAAEGGHDWQETSRTPATCTEAEVIHKSCSHCNATTDETGEAALGHDLSNWEESGDGHHRFCKRNGCTYEETGDHSWGEVSQTEAPTCTKEGTGTRTCEICGAKKTETISVAEHNLTHVAAVEPTCEEDGVVEHWYCSTCKQDFSDAKGTSKLDTTDVLKKGHHPQEVSGKEATCTEEGVIAHWHCTSCEKDYSDSTCTTLLEKTTIDKTAHDMEHHAGVAATCDTEGEKEHWYCKVCKKNYADEQGTSVLEDIILNALEHDLSDTWDCDEENHFKHCEREGCSHTTDPEAHLFTETSSKPASCTEDGEKTETCTVCGYEKKGIILKKAHDLTHVPAQAATCDKDGIIEHWHCSSCGKDFSDEHGENELASVVGDKAFGHAYGGWQKLDNTYHVRKCTHDAAHTEREAHTWDAGTVTRAATATAAGIKTYTCTKCGATRTEKIPAFGVSITGASITVIPQWTYTGGPIMPKPVVRHGYDTLREGTDYTVSYGNNTNVGSAYLVVRGQGKYLGSIAASFQIVPKGTTITKLSKGKKQFAVKWKKQSKQTTGYQIQYSTNKKFTKGVKTVTIKKNKTKSKKIKKLRGKKTYYVRIRTYKEVGGKYYYSAWSGAKKVKTKK